MSMIWSRRDHRAYGTTILITGVAWLALGVAVALARDLSLAAYLIKIFLPSSPALLDCTELARSHWRHATRRENAELGKPQRAGTRTTAGLCSCATNRWSAGCTMAWTWYRTPRTWRLGQWSCWPTLS
jgi:hypothetical protein